MPSRWPAAAAPAPAALLLLPPSPPPLPLPHPRHKQQQRQSQTNNTKVRPWSLLHARVQADVKQRHLLPPNTDVLVAVSGGQDSLCLLQLLVDLKPALQLGRLVVAHCDHRAHAQSAAAAEFVRGLAAAHALEYVETSASGSGSGSTEHACTTGSTAAAAQPRCAPSGGAAVQAEHADHSCTAAAAARRCSRWCWPSSSRSCSGSGTCCCMCQGGIPWQPGPAAAEIA